MCKIARFRDFVRLRLRLINTRRGCPVCGRTGFVQLFRPISLACGSVERFAKVFSDAPGPASAQKSQDVRS